jgi:hypothetical protein
VFGSGGFDSMFFAIVSDCLSVFLRHAFVSFQLFCGIDGRFNLICSFCAVAHRTGTLCALCEPGYKAKSLQAECVKCM